MPPSYDLLVVGGGPVGAAVARAARGLRVALVSHERRVPSRAASDGAFDARVYALSPGNVAFLQDIGVWAALPRERVAPVHSMKVFGDDGRSAIEFDAYEAGVAQLAWIVEDAALQDALWSALEARVFAPAACEALTLEPERALLTLSDGSTLEASLIVGADGASSFVRRAAAIAADERGYGQSAVVANFQCEKRHEDTAYQWFQGGFQGGAVLALLPLPGQQVSMVWSLPSGEAERISGLDAASLCREVEGASRHVLGRLSAAGAQKAYALRRLRARRLVAPRIALAGDAGHVIHPLAGQGLNLGLQDARDLCEVLLGREPLRDPGDLRLLRRYERRRAEPILAMDTMVDALFRLFGAANRPAAELRNAGLNLTDRIPVLKNTLMRYAMR